MKQCAGLLLILMLVPMFAFAQSEQGDDAQYLIDSTAADLANTNPATSANAKKQLIGLGEPAVAAVQKIMRENRSPQVQKLGKEILAALESRFKIDPTLVALKLDNTSPQVVADELSKIAGVRIEGQWDFWGQHPQGMPRQMSVDFNKTPLAQAIYETCQKAHLQIQDADWSASYMVNANYDDSARNNPTYLSGPVLFIIDNIDRDSTIDMSDKSESDNLNINLHLLTDPKLPIRRIYYNALISEAIGDTGESLIDASNPQDENAVNRGPNLTFYAGANLSLKFKTGPNKSIKSLKGAVRFGIPANPVKVEFDQVVAGKTATAGPWTIKIKSISPTNNGYNIHIVADNSESPTANSQPVPNDCLAQLYDAKSLPYIAQIAGSYWRRSSIEFTMHFMPGPGGGPPHAGPPAKLVIDFSTNTRNIRVPFQFTDLPIPQPTY